MTGPEFRKYRRAHKIKLVDVADRFGVSVNTLKKFESGYEISEIFCIEYKISRIIKEYDYRDKKKLEGKL